VGPRLQKEKKATPMVGHLPAKALGLSARPLPLLIKYLHPSPALVTIDSAVCMTACHANAKEKNEAYCAEKRSFNVHTASQLSKDVSGNRHAAAFQGI
jgi:hypothetical protein